MNAGVDYENAKRQAQANANRDGRARRLHLYNGVWWIDRHEAGDVGREGEIIEPDETARILHGAQSRLQVRVGDRLVYDGHDAVLARFAFETHSKTEPAAVLNGDTKVVLLERAAVVTS